MGNSVVSKFNVRAILNVAFVLSLVGIGIFGIWLAWLHEWTVLVFGLLAGVIGIPLAWLVMVGVAVLGLPAVRYRQDVRLSRRMLALPFLATSFGVLHGAWAIWTTGLFFVLSIKAAPDNFLVAFSYSYFVTVFPWIVLIRFSMKVSQIPSIAFFTLNYVGFTTLAYLFGLKYLFPGLIFSYFFQLYTAASATMRSPEDA